MTDIFNYGTDHLTIGICLDIAAGKTKGIINKEAADMIKSSWREVEKIVHSHRPVYGINTGFGVLPRFPELVYRRGVRIFHFQLVGTG